MRNFFLILAGFFVLLIGGGLFLSYITRVTSTFKPTQRIEVTNSPQLQQEQTEAARKTEMEKEKLMEDYKYKLDRYRQDQKLYKPY